MWKLELFLWQTKRIGLIFDKNGKQKGLLNFWNYYPVTTVTVPLGLELKSLDNGDNIGLPTP